MKFHFQLATINWGRKVKEIVRNHESYKRKKLVLNSETLNHFWKNLSLYTLAVQTAGKNYNKITSQLIVNMKTYQFVSSVFTCVSYNIQQFSLPYSFYF
jgi:hypothetical protein